MRSIIHCKVGQRLYTSYVVEVLELAFLSVIFVNAIFFNLYVCSRLYLLILI